MKGNTFNTVQVIKEVTIKAPISKVWQALTDKHQMEEWYFDIDRFEPEVGFEFQFFGGSEEKKYLHLCKIEEVIDQKKLAYSWKYEGYNGDTLVTFELLPDGQNTKLVLKHDGLEGFPNNNPDFAAENFSTRWDDIIGTSLKEYVENK